MRLAGLFLAAAVIVVALHRLAAWIGIPGLDLLPEAKAHGLCPR